MPEKRQNSPIDSPCTHVCTLDFETGYCYGCGRDRAEITGWVKFSAAERKNITNILPERIKKLAEA